MKKIVLFILTMVFSFALFAQTKPALVSTNGKVKDDAYQYIWGTTSDTLTNADTLNYVWRVTGGTLPDINIKLYSDHVSGTAGGTLIAYHSIDGVNYGATGDTITVTSLTADAMDSEVLDLPKFLYPYLKVTMIQSGTAVTVPKVYLYCKLN